MVFCDKITVDLKEDGLNVMLLFGRFCGRCAYGDSSDSKRCLTRAILYIISVGNKTGNPKSGASQLAEI